jgi:hypothetical protein
MKTINFIHKEIKDLKDPMISLLKKIKITFLS